MDMEYPDPHTEYVQSPQKISIPKLAKKWKKSQKTLEYHQHRQGWTKEREEFQKKAKAKLAEKAQNALAKHYSDMIEFYAKAITQSKMAAHSGMYDNAKQAIDAVVNAEKRLAEIMGHDAGVKTPQIKINLTDGKSITIGDDED